MDYRKRIEITDTGMVIASVFAGDGRRVGLEFFSGIFRSVESRARQAHEWAERRMEVCERLEAIQS